MSGSRRNGFNGSRPNKYARISTEVIAKLHW